MAMHYRIVPTPEQVAFFRRIAGCRRFVFNLGLAARRESWEARKAEVGRLVALGYGEVEAKALAPKPLSHTDVQNMLPMWKVEHPFLAEVPSHCLQAALVDLDGAYKAFFEGRAAYPRFARHGESVSFRFPDPVQFRIEMDNDPKGDSNPEGAPRPRGKVTTGQTLHGLLVLPKMGMKTSDVGPVHIVLHRPIIGKMRRVTISERGGMWFASIEVRTPKMAAADEHTVDVRTVWFDGNGQPREPRVRGADVGGRQPVVTSTKVRLGVPLSVEARRAASSAQEVARVVGGPKVKGLSTRVRTERPIVAVETKDTKAKRKRLQQAVARKALKSKNREKARKKLQRFEATLARKRENAIRVGACALLRGVDVLVCEKLPVSKMTRSAPKGSAPQVVAETKRRNRSFLGASPAAMIAWVQQKAERLGKEVLLVDPAYTSRECSECGNRDKANRLKGASVFKCVACGHTGDADKVASGNIARRGRQALDARVAGMVSVAPASAMGALAVDTVSIAGGAPGIYGTGGCPGFVCRGEDPDGELVTPNHPLGPTKETERARRETPHPPLIRGQVPGSLPTR
jgi:putative transposase